MAGTLKNLLEDQSIPTGAGIKPRVWKENWSHGRRFIKNRGCESFLLELDQSIPTGAGLKPRVWKKIGLTGAG
jgi:hypothetical protein